MTTLEKVQTSPGNRDYCMDIDRHGDFDWKVESRTVTMDGKQTIRTIISRRKVGDEGRWEIVSDIISDLWEDRIPDRILHDLGAEDAYDDMAQCTVKYQSRDLRQWFREDK